MFTWPRRLNSPVSPNKRHARARSAGQSERRSVGEDERPLHFANSSCSTRASGSVKQNLAPPPGFASAQIEP